MVAGAVGQRGDGLAPPMVNTRSTPVIAAAASTSGFFSPAVGTTMISSATPATLAGDRVHQHRAGVGGAAPGTYRPTRSKRVTFCSEAAPPCLASRRCNARIRAPGARDNWHAGGSEVGGLPLRHGSGQRRLEFRLRQLQRRHVGDVEMIEAAGEFDHRRVAVPAHGLQDVGDGVLDGRVGTALKAGRRGRRKPASADDRRRICSTHCPTAPAGPQHRLDELALQLEGGLIDDEAELMA